MPGRGDRRDLGLPPRGQREHRRALRDEHPHGGADRACTRGGRPLARLPPRRGRVRAEHDLAQLPAHARVRAHARDGRRDPRHEARPRRQRGAVARARARPRHRRPLRRGERRPHARPRGPRAAAVRPDEGRGVPDRVERGRHDARRRADRRAGAFGRCARLGRRGPLRAARPDRRRGVGRRRPPLLAVQVLRAASRARLRRRRAARLVAAVQGAPGVERAGREPLPARHPAARAARRLRRCCRVRGVAGLGGDRGPRDRARPPLPRRAAGAGRALRASHDVGSRADVLLQPPRASRGRRRHRAGGAGDRRLARRLLRGRGDEAARPRRGGRRPRRLRPLQHGRGGRPPPRGASPELC